MNQLLQYKLTSSQVSWNKLNLLAKMMKALLLVEKT